MKRTHIRDWRSEYQQGIMVSESFKVQTNETGKKMRKLNRLETFTMLVIIFPSISYAKILKTRQISNSHGIEESF